MPPPDSLPEPDTGHRERKKRATRRALALAALQLSVERGLDQVVTEDIARAAGVSPRTFNNYFSSKYEAICSLAVDRAANIGASLLARPAEQPLWEAIEQVVLEQYRDADSQSDQDWMVGLRLVTRTPALLGEYLRAQSLTRDLLEQAIARRLSIEGRRDLGARVIAAAVTAACEVAIDHWLEAEPTPPLVPLVRRALSQLADGFRQVQLPARQSTHKSKKRPARAR
jgi:AcrR family transcriptional regulator